MTTQKEGKPKTPRAPKVNVLDDQGSEDETPNAAFTAALELARQATSAPVATSSPVPLQVQPESQITSKPEKQKASKPDRASEGYTKATYRVRDEAIDAVEDMRLLLKRTYSIKALREEIVEEAILAAQRDLQENGEASFLVRYLRETESQ